MTADEWKAIKWFKPGEFDDPTLPGSGVQHMEWSLVHLLDVVRGEWGKPLFINSGFRSPEHNQEIGGKTRSAHMTGHAADIATENLEEAITLALRFAMEGCRRVGVDLKGKFIHVDTSPFNPSPAVWFYNA